MCHLQIESEFHHTLVAKVRMWHHSLENEDAKEVCLISNGAGRKTLRVHRCDINTNIIHQSSMLNWYQMCQFALKT